MKRKGFYLKTAQDKSIILNVYRPDFIQYLNECEAVGDWVKLRIFERLEIDEKGHTHNMELITHKINKIAENQ